MYCEMQCIRYDGVLTLYDNLWVKINAIWTQQEQVYKEHSFKVFQADAGIHPLHQISVGCIWPSEFFMQLDTWFGN
jgi:hypothetical protein